ncbi:MAG TPA: sulfur carrier protein ThiS [Bryobacteraceae bacterium]|jgi:sulfur carrier protein|nr:sulfur carrier protein ThiS [Bryobacteraceae bacterium]
MQVVVNGESRAVPEDLDVLGLLEHLGITAAKVAVELDGAIVRQPDWTTQKIHPGAQIEIVQFVGGG